MPRFAAKSFAKKTVLRPSQERLLRLRHDRHDGMTPGKICAALDVTKQRAAHILAPLLTTKLVRRIGTRKTGRFVFG